MLDNVKSNELAKLKRCVSWVSIPKKEFRDKVYTGLANHCNVTYICTFFLNSCVANTQSGGSNKEQLAQWEVRHCDVKKCTSELVLCWTWTSIAHWRIHLQYTMCCPTK